MKNKRKKTTWKHVAYKQYESVSVTGMDIVLWAQIAYLQNAHLFTALFTLQWSTKYNHITYFRKFSKRFMLMT